MPCRRREHRTERARRGAGGPPRRTHPDWEGSWRLASSPSRTATGDLAYSPYGAAYAGSGPNGFTGDWVVTPDNLDFTPNRLLAPMMARWLSPDPSGLAAVNPANPQSWNAYAYVADTPLEATDPLGLNGNGSTGCGVGQAADGPCPVVTFTVNAYAYPMIFVGTVATVNVYAGGPSPPGSVNADLTGVPYCAANPLSCTVASLSQHPNGPGPSGSWNNGNSVAAAAMAVPQGPSCSKWQRLAGDASQIADSVSSAAQWVSIGAGVGALVSTAFEVPTAGTDTPATAVLASASVLAAEYSVAAGAAAAVFKSYANGNYGAMGSFDWKHLAADATYLASTQIPGLSKYADQLQQLAEAGLDISVSSPLRCQ